MRVLSRPVLTLAAVCFAAWLATWSNLHAQGLQVAIGQQPIDEKEIEQKIRDALRKPIALVADETPLADVMQQIGKAAEINIVLDTRSIDALGLGGDTLVTSKLEGVSVASALRLMLNELDLTCQIRNEVLLITSKEKAESLMTTKVYEVSDLVDNCRASGYLVYSPLWPQLPGTSAYMESLIDVITTTVECDSWDEVGGPGSIDALQSAEKNVLVVSQTTAVLEQVESLLGKLREVKPRHAEYEDARHEASKRRRPVARIYPIIGDNAKNVSELAELLRDLTGAKLWDEKEGTLLVGKANVVLVRHHPRVHHQIVEVLEEMGAIARIRNGFGCLCAP